MINTRALARTFESTATFIVKRPVNVFVEDDPSYVGYTYIGKNGEPSVYLSVSTPLYGDTDDRTRQFYVLGVLIHECLHQIFTDFESSDRILSRYGDDERRFVNEILNIVEDPAIEHGARSVCGGIGPRALDAVIKHSYDISPCIDADIAPGTENDPESVYRQITSAMIQKGDRGNIKGSFLSGTAAGLWNGILPLFNRAVLEPDGRKRSELAERIYLLLRPLVLRFRRDPQTQSSYSAPPKTAGSGGKGRSVPMPTDEQSPDLPDTGNDTGCGTGTGDSRSGAERSGTSSGSGEDGPPSVPGPLSGTASGTSDRAVPGTAGNPEGFAGPSEQCPSGAEGPSEEDIEVLERQVRKIAEDISGEDEAERLRGDFRAAEIPLNEPGITNIDVRKACPGYRDPDGYEKVIQSYGPEISDLARKLRTLFRSDRGAVRNSVSGANVNVLRAEGPVLRADVLRTRTSPKDLTDMGVYILADNSGSMDGAKMTHARNTCICIYEALQSLNIPLYVTGFTTGRRGSVHRHYVTWNSPKEDRYLLPLMDADNCNMDYFAIRTARDIFRKRDFRHKLLIVVSDGAPCCFGTEIPTYEDAYRAVQSEVRKCRQENIDVLGVAVECCDEEGYNLMYEKNYIRVDSPEDMFRDILGAVRDIVRSW